MAAMSPAKSAGSIVTLNLGKKQYACHFCSTKRKLFYGGLLLILKDNEVGLVLAIHLGVLSAVAVMAVFLAFLDLSLLENAILGMFAIFLFVERHFRR